MKRHWAKKAIFIPLIAAAALIIFGGVVMLLWNGVLAEVIHVGMISFWQAVGLIILSKILFGGFHGHRGHFGGWNRHRQHWMNMTDEERAKMREEWKKRCHPTEG
jgi:Ca2+/H+ antiporter, TMEM165/GDT1 family